MLTRNLLNMLNVPVTSCGSRATGPVECSRKNRPCLQIVPYPC